MNQLPELRVLRSFAMVAEELHFGRAARRLGLSQPPLSQQIKALEQLIGARLFERDNRNVALTAAGSALFDEVRRILSGVERAVERTRAVASGKAGTLRVGFSASAALGMLPAMVREYRARWPEIDIELDERSDQSELLRLGEVDLAIVRAVADTSLVVETIRREPFVAVLHARHPLLRHARIRPRWLANEPFVLFPRESTPAFFDTIIGICRRAGFSPRIAQYGSEWPTVVSLVSARLGVTLAPHAVTALQRGGVGYRPLAGSREVAELKIARPPGPTSAAVEGFLSIARRVGAEFDAPAASRTRG